MEQHCYPCTWHSDCHFGNGLDDVDGPEQVGWLGSKLRRLLHFGYAGICLLNTLARLPRARPKNEDAGMGSRHNLPDDLGQLYAIRLAIWRRASHRVIDLLVGCCPVRLVVQSRRASQSKCCDGYDIFAVRLGASSAVSFASSQWMFAWDGSRGCNLLAWRVLLDVRSQRSFLSCGMASFRNCCRCVPLFGYCRIRGQASDSRLNFKTFASPSPATSRRCFALID
jgi:hypothetical protein